MRSKPTRESAPLTGDFPKPRKLRIDLLPSNRWGGCWWRAEWKGIAVAHSRDPLHAAGRALVIVGKATTVDVIIAFVAGVEIAQESIGAIMKRRAQKGPLASFWGNSAQADALTAAVLALGPPPDPGLDGPEPMDPALLDLPADLQIATDLELSAETLFAI
jgi:hypothetical protein